MSLLFKRIFSPIESIIVKIDTFFIIEDPFVSKKKKKKKNQKKSLKKKKKKFVYVTIVFQNLPTTLRFPSKKEPYQNQHKKRLLIEQFQAIKSSLFCFSSCVERKPNK